MEIYPSITAICKLKKSGDLNLFSISAAERDELIIYIFTSGVKRYVSIIFIPIQGASGQTPAEQGNESIQDSLKPVFQPPETPPLSIVIISSPPGGFYHQ